MPSWQPCSGFTIKISTKADKFNWASVISLLTVI